MHTDAKEGLGWLAFRYIADEMSANEAEAFEQRLAGDQAAREAVAQAVELTQAVAAVPAEVVPLRLHDSPLTTHHSRTRRWLQPVGWMAIGAAACLAAVMLLPGPRAELVRLFRRADDGSLASVLATLWASPELRDMQSDLWHSELLAGSDEPLVATSDPEADAELAAPEWLLRALFSAEGGDRPDADREET